MVAPPLMAYVDPSALTPAISGELPAETRIRRERFPILVSATLLDAELRAAFQDEQQTYNPSLAAVIDRWVTPNRRLDEELAAISEIVSLPALPLWHLASAMYFQQRQSLTGRQFRLAFITLDEQQETAANRLGFFTP